MCHSCPPHLTIKQAAARLNTSERHLRRLCTQHDLEIFRLGGTGDKRYRTTDIDALLVSMKPPAVETVTNAPVAQTTSPHPMMAGDGV